MSVKHNLPRAAASTFALIGRVAAKAADPQVRTGTRRPHAAHGDCGNADDDPERFLTAVQVRRRYGGRSSMWLWRQLHNNPAFPTPLKLGGRMRLWRLSDLRAWEIGLASNQCEVS